MVNKENELAIANQSLAAFSENPITQIDIAKKINVKVYEIFEVDKLLTELNIRIFNGKGTIGPNYQWASISPHISQNKDRETLQSRFSKLFTLNYESTETSLGSELYIKNEDIPNIKNSYRLKGIGIKSYQEIDIPHEILTMYILGKLYFQENRTRNGRWDDNPPIPDRQSQGKLATFLHMQSQGKSLGFSLRSIPPADEVRFVFLENTLQILDDLSEGNFIPSIRDEEGNIKF